MKTGGRIRSYVNLLSCYQLYVVERLRTRGQVARDYLPASNRHSAYVSTHNAGPLTCPEAVETSKTLLELYPMTFANSISTKECLNHRGLPTVRYYNTEIRIPGPSQKL